MAKIFMVWEGECFDNYDVIYISESKEKAITFITELTGETFDPDGEINNGNIQNHHVVWFDREIEVRQYKIRVTSEIYLEERELDEYEPLSV